jgi:hypothetical protein
VTIDIAACGPNAGLAICRSLRAVEHVSTGSTGGFATFAAIAADGDQQLCKVLRPAIGRRGQSAVQPSLGDVIRSDVVMPR